MKRLGPYLTLLTGLILAVALLGAGLVANDGGDDESEAVSATATTPEPAATTSDEVEVIESPAQTTTAAEETTTSPAVEVPDGTYAGHVRGGGASVAVAVKDGVVVAYVCDGAQLEAWFQGEVEGSKIFLEGNGKSTISGRYAKKWLAGKVTVKGQTWSFRVPVVSKPSGLYRSTANVRQAEVVAGWIIVGNDQVGMVSSSTGEESPAPELDLDSQTATIDGTEVEADLVDGTPLD